MSSPLPWSVVQTQINARLQLLITQLEAVSPDNLSYMQGEIAGLRFVLSLPDTIQREVDFKAQTIAPSSPTY